MSERALSTIEWTPRYEHATHAIGILALELMGHRYGDGQPNGVGGHDQRLAFHHLPHAQMVGQQALRLCKYMNLSSTEQKTAELAGYAHDVLQLNGIGINESQSASWLVEQLKTFGIPELSGGVMRAILGTEPKFTNGILTHQVAHEYVGEDLDNAMIRAVASADLSGLYTPSGPHESHALYAEIQGKALGQEVSLESILPFQRDQLELLEGYKYPLREAEELFATHRSEVMEHHTRILRILEDGNFDSFEEVLAMDDAFRLKHS
ncbi:MAG TPA: hypothetical protein VLH38_00835 [Patescibacteria group bacterium]|nr:hypothetical protein [Patescibacteria group bacterium]